MYSDLLEGQLSFNIEPLVILEIDKDIAAVHATYNQQSLTISTNSLRKPSTTFTGSTLRWESAVFYICSYIYVYRSMQWLGFSRGIRKALSRCVCQSENMEPGLPENQLQRGRRIGKVAFETKPMLT